MQRPTVEIAAKPWHYWLVFLIFIILVPYPLFHGLDAQVLRQYDDARRGVNAYEMLHNGNLLVTYYNGKPDLWGTKPPLLVWLQTGFMLILGPGELAVRLPSALAGLFTCLLAVLLSAKYLKNPFFGLIWAAVLITINGYVDYHGTRTGDFDALLTLFMFLYSFAFYLFTVNRRPKYLIYSAVFITLSVMTKGVAGLFFMPALLIWAIISGSLVDIFKSRQTYYGILIFLFIIGGYYLSREFLNPGYLRAVGENELGGRYLNTLEGHHHDTWYYLEGIQRSRLLKWIYLVIPSIIAGFFIREEFARRLHLYSLILIVTHLMIITMSGTKLIWYDLPEFPYFALIIANLLWTVSYLLYQFYNRYRKKILLAIPLIFLLALFYEPVRRTFKEAQYIRERPYYLSTHEVSYYLRDGVKGKMNLDGYVLVFDDYDAHCLFYQYLLKDKGQVVTRKNKEKLISGEKVIVYQEFMKQYIEEHYQFDVLESRDYVRVYSIH